MNVLELGMGIAGLLLLFWLGAKLLQLLATVCALVLVTTLMWATWQHFLG